MATLYGEDWTSQLANAEVQLELEGQGGLPVIEGPSRASVSEADAAIGVTPQPRRAADPNDSDYRGSPPSTENGLPRFPPQDSMSDTSWQTRDATSVVEVREKMMMDYDPKTEEYGKYVRRVHNMAIVMDRMGTPVDKHLVNELTAQAYLMCKAYEEAGTEVERYTSILVREFAMENLNMEDGPDQGLRMSALRALLVRRGVDVEMLIQQVVSGGPIDGSFYRMTPERALRTNQTSQFGGRFTMEDCVVPALNRLDPPRALTSEVGAAVTDIVPRALASNGRAAVHHQMNGQGNVITPMRAGFVDSNSVGGFIGPDQEFRARAGAQYAPEARAEIDRLQAEVDAAHETRSQADLNPGQIAQVLAQQTELLKGLIDRPAKKQGGRSTIRVEPRVVWPKLDDHGSGGREVEEFYTRFEEICNIANDGEGMADREMIIALKNSLHGSRKRIFENVEKALKDTPDEERAGIVYATVKKRLMRFLESPLERQLRVRSEWDSFNKGRNMSAIQFEAEWEQRSAEMVEVGLCVPEKEKFCVYVQKIGEPNGTNCRLDRRPRKDRDSPTGLPMVNRLPDSWEELHETMIEIEGIRANSRAYSTSARTAGMNQNSPPPKNNDQSQGGQDSGKGKGKGKGDDKGKGKGKCFNWANLGECKFGKDCKYAHEGPGKSKAGPQKTKAEKRKPKEIRLQQEQALLTSKVVSKAEAKAKAKVLLVRRLKDLVRKLSFANSYVKAKLVLKDEPACTLIIRNRLKENKADKISKPTGLPPTVMVGILQLDSMQITEWDCDLMYRILALCL